MRIPHLPLALLLALALSACGAGAVNFDVDFSPSQLAVNATGVQSNPLEVTFVNRPGSIGFTVQGYQLRLLDNAGQPVLAGQPPSEGSLALEVPAGLACAAERCSINMPNAEPAVRTASKELTLEFAPEVLARLVELGQARAEFVFDIRDALNRRFPSRVFRLDVVVE